jgi:hypothetical protein
MLKQFLKALYLILYSEGLGEKYHHFDNYIATRSWRVKSINRNIIFGHALQVVSVEQVDDRADEVSKF